MLMLFVDIVSDNNGNLSMKITTKTYYSRRPGKARIKIWEFQSAHSVPVRLFYMQ